MSSNKEDQKYVNACKIVASYEKGLRSTQSKTTVLIGLDSNLSIIEEMIKAAEISMKDMKDPTGTQGQTQEQVTTQAESKSQENSCDSKDEKPFVEYDGKGQVSFNASKSVDIEEKVYEFLGSDVNSSQVRDSLEECFDCNLRASFDFQIRPINLLNEIMPLINQLSNIVDMLLSELRPTNLLKGICDLSYNFRFWCLQDILNVIVALTGLTKRYMGQFIKIALNWTFIIGPIVKLIVDVAAKFMEQIRRMIIAPLDCATGVLSTFLNFSDRVKDEYDTLAAFASVFPEEDQWRKSSTPKGSRVKKMKGFKPEWGFKDPKVSTTLMGGNPGTPYAWEFNANDSLESSFEKEKNRMKRERALKAEEKRMEKVREKQYSLLGKELEGKDLYKITEEELKEIEKELNKIDEQEKGSMLRNLLFTLNSSKAWVNELFANLLLAVKSLNSLIAGSLGLSMKLGSWILMIFDLIKVVQVIIKLVQSGGLGNLCKDLEEDPDKVKNVLERYLDESDFNLAESFNKELERFDQRMASIEQNSCA